MLLRRRWTDDPSFFCELLRRQGCNPCRGSDCDEYCLAILHEVKCNISHVLKYCRANMNNCPFCRQTIAPEYRLAHCCKGFPAFGRRQLILWNIPETVFNRPERMQKKRLQPSLPSPTPISSVMQLHKDAKTSTLLWPFEQVFVWRLPDYRNNSDGLYPTRPACGKIDCVKRYCIPESHEKSQQCTTPNGINISMGEYMISFPKRCPFCYTELKWASLRVLHECFDAPLPYGTASDYQKEISECLAMRRIERRGHEAEKQRNRAKMHEMSRIESHLRLCTSWCKCKNCTLHNSAGDALCIIVKSNYGNLRIVRPPKHNESDEPPSLDQTRRKKRRTTRHLLNTSKRPKIQSQRIKWNNGNRYTDGGGGGGGGGKSKDDPYVMRYQPVASREFIGTDLVPVDDTGYLTLPGFDHCC